MADFFFALSERDQRDALAFASARIGRPAFLLEKDLWVVWTLRALYESPLADVLTFKGGTSLSKAYGIIHRFSEDIDLTYNIRYLLPDLMGESDLPRKRSEMDRWTAAIRERLPPWIDGTVIPIINKNLASENLSIQLAIDGPNQDTLLLRYPTLAEGPSYVAPVVKLEFGGRATGQPHGIMPIISDMEGQVPGVFFPAASPVVMEVGRTFWEKATAAHVYTAQHRIRGERYARHWHDLAAIARSSHFERILADTSVATMVADHKQWFFREKDAQGNLVDYAAAARGQLHLVPEGRAREALAADYNAMRDAGVLLAGAMTFDELMQACGELQTRINQAVSAKLSID